MNDLLQIVTESFSYTSLFDRLIGWAGLHLYSVRLNSFIVHTLLIRRWMIALLVVAPPGAEEGDDTSGHIGEQGQGKTSNSNSYCDTCIGCQDMAKLMD